MSLHRLRVASHIGCVKFMNVILEIVSVHIAVCATDISGDFPTQRASNAGNVPIWWRHHGSAASDIVQYWSAIYKKSIILYIHHPCSKTHNPHSHQWAPSQFKTVYISLTSGSECHGVSVKAVPVAFITAINIYQLKAVQSSTPQHKAD